MTRHATVTIGFWFLAAGVLCGTSPASPGAQAGSEQSAPKDPSTAKEVVATAPKKGDDVILVFHDGRRMSGTFGSDDGVTLVATVAGVDLKLPAASIGDIIVLDPPSVRYERMRGMTGEDVDRIVDLADWCRRHDLYPQALSEVERALDIDPHDPDALRLRKLVAEQHSLFIDRKHKREHRKHPSQDSPQEIESFERRPKPSDFPLLNEQQINLIKVYEIDLNKPPRIVIERETVDKLLASYASSPLIPSTREGRQEIHRMEGVELLDLMFRLRARELYTEIKVMGQPQSMKLFRDRVNSAWLVNRMATTRCHGSAKGGRLQLTNRRPSSDEAAYTNFYILAHFETLSGEPLINVEEPGLSPLLQMGLPREDSVYPHPDVYGWKPVFRGRDSKPYQRTVEWIASLYRPRPEYPIEYTPPGADVHNVTRFPEDGVER